MIVTPRVSAIPLSWEVATLIEHVYDLYMSSDVATPVAVTDALEARIASAAGARNLANAELTQVIADALADQAWGGTSPTQWLVYRAGTTTADANRIITVAEARDRFPTIIARFDAGELSLEQVVELVNAPPEADADIEHWGTIATPSRIRRSIKRRYGDTPKPDETSDDVSKPDPAVEREWLGTGVTNDHRWRIKGEFDLDSAAVIDAALVHARERLWERGQREITGADCLREVAHGYLDQIDSPLQRDRAKIWLHIDADTGHTVGPTGIRIPDTVADKISCDGIIQPVWERDGVAFNVGRAQHIVPERTRRIVILRDQGCRVPGCTHDRIIEIHHIIHWNNGGVTDTWNLVALCPKHHRMHHHGRLDITGNADQPDGLVFTDQHGRRLQPCAAPTPPTQLTRPTNGYTPPPMGRVDWNYVGLGWPDPTTNELE